MNDLERLAAQTRAMIQAGGLDPESSTFAWWSRREEHRAKPRDHAYVEPEHMEFHYSKKLARLDPAHQRAVIAHEVGHVLAWHHWKDPSEAAADRAAREFLGMTITYDRSFGGKGLQMTTNPVSQDVMDRIHAEAEAWRAAKADRIAQIEALLAASPAIRGRMGDHDRMAIVSGELSDRVHGDYRVTYFGTDGPHGHATRRSMGEIAKDIEDSMQAPYTSMTEADVIAWTSTPEFEVGSRVIAYVQAENMFRYLASRAGKTEWAYQVIREVNDAAGPRPHTPEVIEEATAKIVRAMETLPVSNPRIAGFVMNPPWVTGALAQGYETLERVAPAKWMPALASVSARGGRLTAKLVEFGCGKYGCVMPTLDPKIVLKVTTDESEATFAADLSPTLIAPICVEYPMVADLDVWHDGAQVHLLWREAADHVGKLFEELGKAGEDLVGKQHDAAALVLRAIWDGKGEKMIRARVAAWLEACEKMARQTQVPELRPLGAGMIEVYERQRIFFGDVHPGNLGVVTRGGKKSWVITDPGNVEVLTHLL